MAEDFLSLEQAGQQLGLDPDELKRLVGEGEIRAFRDAGSMKFRHSDVEAFQRVRSASATGAEYPTAGVGEAQSEELVFDASPPASSKGQEPGMVTEEIEIEEEAPARPKPRPTRARTRPGARARRPAPGRSMRARPRGEPAAAATVVPEAAEPVWIQGLLIVTLFVMLIGAAFAYSAPRARQTGLTQSISELILGH